MRFWLTFEMRRQEGNRFDGAESRVPGALPEGLQTLIPGSNTIDLDVMLPEGIGEQAHLAYTIADGL